MKKRWITVFLILVLVCPTSSTLSEDNSFYFIYEMNGSNYKLDWEDNIDQLSNGGLGYLLDSHYSETQIPFWSDTTKLTSEKIGYSLKANSLNLQYLGISIQDLELFYYFDIGDTGTINNSLSHLYLVKMNVSPSEENGFKKHLNTLSKKYGKPILKEKVKDEVMYSSRIQIGSYVSEKVEKHKIHHSVYTWNCSGTGMRITLDYDENENSYRNTVIYIGRTDKDFLLNRGNYSIDSDGRDSQVTVEKKRIALRDENKKIIQKLEVGTELLIIGYDRNLDMFAAIVVDGSSNAEEKAAKGAFDGYVHGDYLSVSRAELLRKIKD